jgi:uncharacterized small protein (DUF1192 family)
MSEYGEPWKPRFSVSCLDREDKWVFNASNTIRDRIILCVNACAGISDDELETLKFLELGLKERILLLYQQIDELQAENAKLKEKGN